MSTPFLGEIKLFSFNWAPRGWALCQGQLLSIAQNSALFSLLGTYYGGNGVQNFALPDLRGRVPIHQGNGYTIGEMGGQENVALNQSQLPSHQHALEATTAAGTAGSPIGHLLAQPNLGHYGSDSSNLVTMNPASIQPQGGSQAHDNMQPYLALNYCIALQGAFPSRN